jgi:hypothetical protein
VTDICIEATDICMKGTQWSARTAGSFVARANSKKDQKKTKETEISAARTAGSYPTLPWTSTGLGCVCLGCVLFLYFCIGFLCLFEGGVRV